MKPLIWKKSVCDYLPTCWYGLVPDTGPLSGLMYKGSTPLVAKWYVEWYSSVKRWAVYKGDGYNAPIAFAETPEEGMGLADALYNDERRTEALVLAESAHTIKWDEAWGAFRRGRLYPPMGANDCAKDWVVDSPMGANDCAKDWVVETTKSFYAGNYPVERWVVRHYTGNEVLAYADSAEEGMELAELMQSELDEGLVSVAVNALVDQLLE